MMARPFPLLPSLLLACACHAAAATAQAAPGKPAVTVTRVEIDDRKVYQVEAGGEVRAAPATVWKILTDYERMPEFVPDLQSSRVLSRSPNRAVVEQFGSAHFLFIRRDIHLVVQVDEQPMSRIDIDLVAGDMTLYHCRWELTPIAQTGGTRIDYAGTLAPKFYVPGILGANLIGADIARMMAAVFERLDRSD